MEITGTKETCNKCLSIWNWQDTRCPECGSEDTENFHDVLCECVECLNWKRFDGDIIYEWKVPKDFKNYTGIDDLAEAYIVVSNENAMGGIVVYSKYKDGEWVVHHSTSRPLINHLVTRLNIGLPSE
jgi:hypothetical protein